MTEDTPSKKENTQKKGYKDNFKNPITYDFKLKQLVRDILEINATPFNQPKNENIKPKKP
jgi:hypothetical protein